MIHFLTAHRGGRWVDIQLAYLRRRLREPYEVWASVESVPDELAAKFDHAIPMEGGHAEKLNRLWRIVDEEAADDDIVVFLDSDTLTIADPLPLIRAALERHALVAVKRVENDGDRQPHPCFAAATARTWRALGCDWRPGHLWPTSSGGLTTDVGANVLRELEAQGISWLPLYRSNAVDLHPLLFGVYGGAVYHHGAGSRRFPLSRLEAKELRGRSSWLRRRLRMWRNSRLSDEVFEQLRDDPEFWRRFLPDERA